jgi:Periplasmic protease
MIVAKSSIVTFIVVIMTLFSLAGCESMLHEPNVRTNVKPEEFEKKYSPEELKNDLKMLMETLEAVHPNLYANKSKSVIDSLHWILEQELTTPMTRIEFYFKIAPLVARLGDAHTNVGVPWEEYEYYRSKPESILFPFNITYDTLLGVTITRNYSNDSVLAVGDRIVSINGCSMDSLFLFFLSGFSGERIVFRQMYVAGYLRMLLWLNNILPPYDLLVQQRGSQKQIEIRVGGVTRKEFRKIDSLRTIQSTVHPKYWDYSYERLRDSIGYIDFRLMANLEKFRKFLSTTFTDIQTKPIKGLIIDLRSNRGGDPRLGLELLPFITDSSYRMAQRVERRMSVQYKAYVRKMAPRWLRWFPWTWVNSEMRTYLGAQDGEIIIDTPAVEPPDANSLRYRGKTCFLIGCGTFSGAMILANIVADFKLATLIGEETGGIPTAYGTIYPFDLPNTKLHMSVSIAFFVRANGNTKDRRGIIPDIEVRQTEVDNPLGKDMVLERARQWIIAGK